VILIVTIEHLLEMTIGIHLIALEIVLQALLEIELKTAMIALDHDHLHAFLNAIPQLRTDFAETNFVTSWMAFTNEQIGHVF
jgi:hypothetical protein